MKDLFDKFKSELNEFIYEGKDAVKQLKSKETIKNQTANLFTFSRLLLVPFIIFNLSTGNLIIAGFLTGGAALTDCIDGYAARKLNITSEFGRKLDAIIDKIFVFMVAIPLAAVQTYLIVPITLDLLIGGINGYSYLKGYGAKTSEIGRKKTIVLDTLVASSFFTSNHIIKSINPILYVLTIGFQLKAGHGYCKTLQENINKKTKPSISTRENNQNEPIKKNEFNRKPSEKELLEYLKHECLREDIDKKNVEKQFKINKNDNL